MRARTLSVVLFLVVAFLLATNPVVAQAKRLVTGGDIKNNSVTGRDIRNGSLLLRDFRRGQVPAGPAGADGVSAIGFVDYRYNRDSGFVPVSLPSDGSKGDVVALGSGAGQRSGPVVVTEASRLFVEADAYLHNGDSVSRALQCFLELRPEGGTAEQMSFESYDSLAQFENDTWSQSASQDVGPGTYDVALRCSTGLNNAGGRVFFADINVLAVRSAL